MLKFTFISFFFLFFSLNIYAQTVADISVGNQTRVKIVKNKVAPPFRTVDFDIMYGEGISKLGELIDIGVKANIIEKSGSWFSFDNVRIGQGRENVKTYLKENKEMADKIENLIRQNQKVVIELATEVEAEPNREAILEDA